VKSLRAEPRTGSHRIEKPTDTTTDTNDGVDDAYGASALVAYLQSEREEIALLKVAPGVHQHFQKAPAPRDPGSE